VDCKACKLIRDDHHINAHARGQRAATTHFQESLRAITNLYCSGDDGSPAPAGRK
jgi:hypothetical protein